MGLAVRPSISGANNFNTTSMASMPQVSVRVSSRANFKRATSSRRFSINPATLFGLSISYIIENITPAATSIWWRLLLKAGILGSVIQISALSVFDAGKQLPLSDPVAPQLVGHDHPRFILQTVQQSFEEALCRLGIAPGLNQDVEHNAMLIDGPPEIMLHALDPDKDLVHVPLITGSRPTPAQSVGETRCEFLAPAPHRLVGDDNTAFRQDQLDIPETKAEYVVQPDRVADDLGREPIAVVGSGDDVIPPVRSPSGPAASAG
jgi:hypothetical protein